MSEALHFLDYYYFFFSIQWSGYKTLNALPIKQETLLWFHSAENSFLLLHPAQSLATVATPTLNIFHFTSNADREIAQHTDFLWGGRGISAQ